MPSKNCQFSSVQLFSRVWLFAAPQTAARLPCPSATPRVYSNSCPLSQWRHPTISSSIIPFSFYLQSCSASGFFLVCQFFASGGQSIGASASVLPMNIQDWFSLGLTGLISLQSKGLLRVFSNTIVQKHQFFGAQLSLWSNSHPYMTTGKTTFLGQEDPLERGMATHSSILACRIPWTEESDRLQSIG